MPASTGPFKSRLTRSIDQIARAVETMQRSTHCTDSKPEQGFDAPTAPKASRPGSSANLRNLPDWRR